MRDSILKDEVHQFLNIAGERYGGMVPSQVESRSKSERRFNSDD